MSDSARRAASRLALQRKTVDALRQRLAFELLLLERMQARLGPRPAAAPPTLADIRARAAARQAQRLLDRAAAL